MLARYTDVQKGMCADEFRAFKECVQVSLSISSLVENLVDHQLASRGGKIRRQDGLGQNGCRDWVDREFPW